MPDDDADDGESDCASCSDGEYDLVEFCVFEHFFPLFFVFGTVGFGHFTTSPGADVGVVEVYRPGASAGRWWNYSMDFK